VDDTGRVNIASSDADGLRRAMQMVNDLTAVPEVGKTYLGKVVRLAEFGAFVEIFPGTDGLLHISEIAEHRVREVKDELNEGDQVLVKVLGVEGNRIKLSRKAVLKEQRAKLGLPDPAAPAHSGEPVAEMHASAAPRGERQPSSNASTITLEGGDDFDDEDGDVVEGEEPNFNRVDGAAQPVGTGGRPQGAGDPRRRGRGRGGRGRRPGGPGAGGSGGHRN